MTVGQTSVLILLSYYVLPFKDRAKDKGTNSIGSRLNRMEDKVTCGIIPFESSTIHAAVLFVPRFNFGENVPEIHSAK